MSKQTSPPLAPCSSQNFPRVLLPLRVANTKKVKRIVPILIQCMNIGSSFQQQPADPM